MILAPEPQGYLLELGSRIEPGQIVDIVIDEPIEEDEHEVDIYI